MNEKIHVLISEEEIEKRICEMGKEKIGRASCRERV